MAQHGADRLGCAQAVHGYLPERVPGLLREFLLGTL